MSPRAASRAARSLVAVAVVAALSLAGPACSSDDEAGDAAPSTVDSGAASGSSGAATSADDGSSTTADATGPDATTPDSTVEEPPAAEACQTMSQVEDLQQQMNEAMAGSGDWGDVQQAADGLRTEIAEFYRMAALEVPELSDELRTVGQFTDDGLAAMQEAPDMDRYITTVEGLPGMQDAVDATTTIDDWTQENCGFPFAN